MPVCPTAGELTAFLAGSCDGETALRIESHLAECETCCSWCMEHDSKDPLLDDVRKVLDTANPSGSTVGSVLITEDQEELLQDNPVVSGYEILHELGRGGMGVVYRAVQLDTKREVALKVLLDGAMASTRAKRRFEREVEVAASLSHPNIATILESGLSHGKYYFSMQFLEGQTLEEHIRGGGIDVAQIGRIFETICSAVDYAHRNGVIHRDIKPSNIIVDDQDTPHVLDFGLAKTFVDESLESMDQISMPGELMGTLPYMSPEQVTGRIHEVDTRSDIYAVGVMLFKQLTGRYPYSVSGRMQQVIDNIVKSEPSAPSKWRDGINHDLDTIVLKCLRKEPERRYQSAGELREDLSRWGRGELIEAKRDSTLYVLGKTLRRMRREIAVGTVILGAVAVAAFTQYQAMARAQRIEAGRVLAAMVAEPVAGLQKLQAMSSGVASLVKAQMPNLVDSSSYTDRVTGVRASFFADQDLFWNAIENGEIGDSGEWLELAALPPELADEIQDRLIGILATGTSHQRYVALCLAGKLAGTHELRSDLSIAAREALGDEDAGVASAALWASTQANEVIDVDRLQGGILFDDVTGLVFAKVPSTEAFATNDPTDDDWAEADEATIPPIPIDAFMISRTEIPVRLFMAFLEDVYPDSTTDYQNWYDGISQGLGRPGDVTRDAAGLIDLSLARELCDWLSAEASKGGKKVRYRLPTEAEWEYAARAGGKARYCYGDDPKYLEEFARFGGADIWHAVGERMPNRYGAVDMHGGVWEWCESRYPTEFRQAFGMAERELWMLKGGAYYSPARKCRATARNFGTVDAMLDYYGVRLVMEVEP